MVIYIEVTQRIGQAVTFAVGISKLVRQLVPPKMLPVWEWGIHSMNFRG